MYHDARNQESQVHKIHSECASTWHNNWQLIESCTDDKLQQQMETQYDNLKKNSPASTKQRIQTLQNKQKYQRPQFYPRVQTLTGRHQELN
jgi:hypothetical protein